MLVCMVNTLLNVTNSNLVMIYYVKQWHAYNNELFSWIIINTFKPGDAHITTLSLDNGLPSAPYQAIISTMLAYSYSDSWQKILMKFR